MEVYADRAALPVIPYAWGQGISRPWERLARETLKAETKGQTSRLSLMASAKLMPIQYLGGSTDRPCIVYQRTRFYLEICIQTEVQVISEIEVTEAEGLCASEMEG